MLTISEIKHILKCERLSISKYRGQNFLVDENLQTEIINLVSIGRNDQVIEIGPGLGALTESIAQGAREVIAIEKDRGLHRVLKKKLSEYKNLKIIHQDILKTDLARLINGKAKVVGNLPYYITTPIIGLLLEKYHRKISQIFITVQYEVGKRLVAQKDSKDYSSLSVLTQYYTDPKILLNLAKRAFYPQPRVNSVFLKLEMLKNPRVSVKSQAQFFKIVHACFQQRRKTIINPLSHKLKDVAKDKIKSFLVESGIDPKARAENLSLDEFAKIENIFYKRRVAL